MAISKRRVIIEAIMAVIFWGASFVATKIALRSMNPDVVIWMRFTLGLFIMGMAVIIKRIFILPDRKDWTYFILLGFIGIAFHQWLQSTGLITAQATTTGWIVSSIPIFMALLGWLVLGEKITWLQGAGITLSAFGVMLVVTHGELALIAVGKFGSFGDFLILLSAPNWAIFSILSRRGLRKYPATMMMFYVMAFGWFFLSILFLSKGGISQFEKIPLEGWASIGFLGIFCSGISYIFWYDALQVLPVAQTGAYLYFEPVITIIIAMTLLDERLTIATFIGGGLILSGVWMVNKIGKIKEESDTS